MPTSRDLRDAAARRGTIDCVAHRPAPEVTTFIARWEECWHWAGEEPYDAARRKEIEDGVARTCPGNDEKREQLRTTYRVRPDVLDALKKLDEMQ